MNYATRLHLGAACATLFTLGCGDSTVTPDVPPADVSPNDASDAPDVVDASDFVDALDVVDARDVADAPDVADASDVVVSDVTPRDVADVTEAGDAGGLIAPIASSCTVAFADPAALCRTTPCAATANATVRCAGEGFGVSVAAGATRARVMYTDNQGGFHTMHAALDLAARTGNVEQAPTGNWPARVLSTRDGGDYVAAYSADAGDHDAMAVFTREAGGWRRVIVEGGRYVPITFGNGAHHADGRESFAYVRGEGASSAYMAATRGADGTWRTSTLAAGPTFGLFAIDTAPDLTGDITLARWRFGVPTTTARSLLVSAGGETPRTAYVQDPGGSEAFNHVSMVTRAAPSPVVAVGLEDGVHLVTATASGFSHALVANTARGHDGACPGTDTGIGLSCGTTRTCTARGTYGGSGSHSLARTADGRVWLVYTQQILDRDYHVVYPPRTGPGCPPSVTVMADRTRTELVVAEVAATLTERARLVLADGANNTDLAVDVAGNSIQIVRYGDGEALAGSPSIRFVAVDTASRR